VSYRIGWDVDGVVADFMTYWARFLRDAAGNPVTPIRGGDATVSDLAVLYGVDKKAINAAWREFDKVPNSWERVPSLLTDDEWWRLRCLMDTWEVTWITARGRVTGRPAAEQTARWLQWHLLVQPTVFTVEKPSDKPAKCEELGITVMVDDHPRAVQALAEAGITVFTLDYPYNRHLEHPKIVRIPGVGALLDILEEANGQAHPRADVGLA